MTKTSKSDDFICLDLPDTNDEHIPAILLGKIDELIEITNVTIKKSCKKLTDRTIELLSCMKQICSLTVHGAQFTDTALSQLITELDILTFLDLSGCTQLSGKSMKSIANLPKLATLDISGCCHITDDSLKFIPRTILDLGLANCHQITNEGPVSIVHPQIKINVDGCERVQFSVGKNTNFEIVTSSYIENTHIQRKHTAKTSSDCLYLDLSDKNDDDVFGILDNMKDEHLLRITTVVITAACKGLTDNTIKLFKPLKQIRSLAVHGDQFTDLALSTLIASLIMLTYLDLSDCAQLSDKSMESISNLTLTTLDISRCCLVTDEALKCIPRNLLHLRLANCKQITNIGITNINISHTRIKIHVDCCSDVGLFPDKHPNFEIVKPTCKRCNATTNAYTDRWKNTILSNRIQCVQDKTPFLL
jgi:hypothetical protein